MIEPMVSMAFSVYSNKGAYALLIGSGASRAAGIRTGWEVVLDLIRKIAKLEGENCEPDPEAWFRQRHGVEPDYSRLLDDIAKTQADRQQLLRSYFEPTQDERAQGLKVPSAAHKAIAQLVVWGYVRVILTTNFDRLIEKALEEADVRPAVVSTPDQVAGMLPLAHSGATVIKVNGDYLDTRIRNTPAELAAYDPALDKLLDQVFDEYGLIICGWSAEWDTALRAAIERCPSRRFTTFWTACSPLSEHAKRLAQHRRAEVVQITDANGFFEKLRQSVQSLQDLAARHPLSPKMAAAAVKRYLVDDGARIRLHDLVKDETEKLYAELNIRRFPPIPHEWVRGPSCIALPPDPAVEHRRRLADYDALSETLLAILTIGSHHGETKHADLWVKAINRIAKSAWQADNLPDIHGLRQYPAMRLLFGAGVAAIAAGKYETLLSLLTEPCRQEGDRHEHVILYFPDILRGQNASGRMPVIPLGGCLLKSCREPLTEVIPAEEDYRACFDRFEYFLGMVRLDLVPNEPAHWRAHFAYEPLRSQETDIRDLVEHELNSQGDACAYLKAGFFGGSAQRMREVKNKLDADLHLIQPP